MIKYLGIAFALVSSAAYADYIQELRAIHAESVKAKKECAKEWVASVVDVSELKELIKSNLRKGDPWTAYKVSEETPCKEFEFMDRIIREELVDILFSNQLSFCRYDGKYLRCNANIVLQ